MWDLLVDVVAVRPDEQARGNEVGVLCTLAFLAGKEGKPGEAIRVNGEALDLLEESCCERPTDALLNESLAVTYRSQSDVLALANRRAGSTVARTSMTHPSPAVVFRG